MAKDTGINDQENLNRCYKIQIAAGGICQDDKCIQFGASTTGGPAIVNQAPARTRRR